MAISPLSFPPFNYSGFRSDNQQTDLTGANNPLSESGDNADIRVRTKRADSDSDSNSGPPTKKSRTEPPVTQGAESATPSPASDAYAEHVLSVGGRMPLSDTQLSSFREGVAHAVRRSQGWLADQHTADAIRDTVLDALDRSPTFRAAVSYGMHNRQDDLDDISYRNHYSVNPRAADPNAPRNIGALTLDDLQRSNAAHMPIVPANQAGRDAEYATLPPYISLSVAPDAGSPYMPSWRQMLMHEIIHHITGARDPVEISENVHGPTELLSRRIADEMHWSIPHSNGYDDPARNAHIDDLCHASLIDAARRHGDHQHEFFERIDAISRGNAASHDFRELGDRPSNGTHAEPPGGDYLDFDQIELHPDMFSLFAQSAPAGAPTGFPNATAASGAGWETQGRFFRYGKPVDGNPHQRAFAFPDESKVVISAHAPMLADSDGLKFGRFMTVASSAAVGGVAGFMAGGPPGAIAGAVAAAIPSSTLAHAYEFDRIWQGYTLDYYNKGSDKPFHTQYMYAWDSDAKRVARLSMISDPNKLPDYGSFNPDQNWNWWKWKAGNAPRRS